MTIQSHHVFRSKFPVAFPDIAGVVQRAVATLTQNPGRGRENLPGGYVLVSLPRVRCLDSDPRYRFPAAASR